MFDAQFPPKLLLPGLHIGGRGLFKKVQFLGIFAFTMWLVLSGIEAGCAVLLVRLDSTMFDAQYKPKLYYWSTHRRQGNF